MKRVDSGIKLSQQLGRQDSMRTMQRFDSNIGAMRRQASLANSNRYGKDQLLQGVQESAADILLKNQSQQQRNSIIGLATRQSSNSQNAISDAHDSTIIHELLNWNDGNIQKLLESLDGPKTTSVEAYDNMKGRMDRLFGDATHYKALSHAEMEAVLDAFDMDKMSPAMLEELNNNEEFRHAFQKATLTKIPRQVNILLSKVTSMIEGMRRGNTPTVEQEQMLMNEAQQVLRTCGNIQSTLGSLSRSVSKLNLADYQQVDKRVALPRLSRKVSLNNLSLLERSSSSSFRMSRKNSSKDFKNILEESNSSTVPQVRVERNISSVDYFDASAPPSSSQINPLMNPKAVITAPKRSQNVEKKLTATMATQTDPLQTEPIVELSGQRCKGADAHDAQKLRLNRKNSSSTFTIAGMTNPSSTRSNSLFISSQKLNTGDSPSSKPADVISNSTGTAVTAVSSPKGSSYSHDVGIEGSVSPKSATASGGKSDLSPSRAQNIVRSASVERQAVQDIINKLPTLGTAESEEELKHLLTPQNILSLQKYFLAKATELDAHKAQQAKSHASSRTTSPVRSALRRKSPHEETLEQRTQQSLLSTSASSQELLASITTTTTAAGKTTHPSSPTSSQSESFRMHAKKSASAANLRKDEVKTRAPRRSSMDPHIGNIEFPDVDPATGKFLLPVSPSGASLSRPTSSIPLNRPRSVQFDDETQSSPEAAKIPTTSLVETVDALNRDLPQISVKMIAIPPPLKTDKATMTDDGRMKEKPLITAAPLNPSFVIDVKRIASKPVVAAKHKPVIDPPQSLSVESAKIDPIVDVQLPSPPPPEFSLKFLEEKLSVSSNPLQDLHTLFGACMSSVYASRLLRASLDDEFILKQSTAINNMFASILQELIKLQENADEVHRKFIQCELSATAVFQATNLDKNKANDIVLKSYEEFYSNLGDIEISILAFDVYLAEFRVIFERLNSQGIAVLPTLVNKSRDFKDSLAAFTYCQSKSIEFKKKINIVYEFISKNELHPEEYSTRRRRLDGIDATTEAAEYEAMITALYREKEDLEESLATANADIAQLETELFEVDLSADRTPSALLFFTALNDMTTTENLQQLSLQLKKLKEFAECKSHMDFVDVRKRLQVCGNCLPHIDKFLSTFKNMHMEWTKRRLTIFEQRREKQVTYTPGTVTGELLKIYGQSQELRQSSTYNDTVSKQQQQQSLIPVKKW